ncbi:MAG: hypothetical protein ACO1PI_01100 [Bacteroidota bacterium]
MIMIKKLLILFSVPLVISACKKEESPDPGNVNGSKVVTTPFPGPKAQVMIAEKWKLTNKTVEYSNGLPTEDFSNVPACQKDNVITFKATKKYDVEETTDVCPGNQPVTTYNWVVDNNEQTITLNGTTWNIVSVDNTTLVLKHISSSQFLTVTTNETYTAQ